jgi:hypothetical protein
VPLLTRTLLVGARRAPLCADVSGKFTFLLVAAICSAAAQTPLTSECRQRIAEDFVPMGMTARLAYAEKSVAGVPAFAFVALRAGIEQGAGREKEWGSDASGFGLRAASVYAEYFIGQSIEQGSAMLLHEDNRYFGSGRHGFAPRLWYAISSAALARRDDGSRKISISALSGAAGGALLSRPWQPPGSGSMADAGVSFGLTMGVRAGLNAVREFSPRLLAWFLE